MAVAARLDARNQRIAVGSRDRGLARRIGVGDDHRVGVVEAGGEIVEQAGQPRIAMRLHDRDDLAFRRGARRLEHGCDLDRVMAVIVEDQRPVPLPGLGEAALHAAEAGKRGADALDGDAEIIGDRDRRGGVERVVMAGHRHDQVTNHLVAAALAVADQERELRLPAREIDVDQPEIGLGIFAIGDDAAVLDLPDEALHGGMVDAHHREAVEGQVLDEGAESRLDRVEGAEMVEMLGVDIGDDGDVRGQLQEGAVRFVSLDHHPVTLAHAGIGAVGVDDAAIDHGRVEPALLQERRDERGRRRLAMGAGDRDAALQPHQLGQHLGPAHHRQALLARGDELGIVALDRGRDHDDLGLAEILRLVPDEGGDALLGEALDVGAVRGVGALHLVAEIVQHLGDAGHADAADPDEVNGAELRRQLHDAAILGEVRSRRRP